MELMDYYKKEKNLKAILNGVTDPGHRVWKVVQLNGVVRQNKKKINTTKKLKEFIGTQPAKIYVSVSKFLNPCNVYGKTPIRSQWKIADSLFLGSELYFDFDCKEDINKAWKDCKGMMEVMKSKKEYELIQMTYSGTKGFNLIYKDLKPVKHFNPLHRLELTEIRRILLLKRLPKFQTLDDLSSDQFRIRAAPNTIKVVTGHKVSIMFPTLTCGDIYERVVRPRPMIDRHRTNKLGKERPTLISYPFFYKFITNQIKGTNGMYVPVLKYRQNNINIQHIRKIQLLYKLSDLHVFRYSDLVMYIGTKLVDKRRLEKIMKAADPINLRGFLFYGHSWIPFSEAVDSKKTMVWDEPRYIGVMRSKEKGSFTDLKQNKVCTASYKLEG